MVPDTNPDIRTILFHFEYNYGPIEKANMNRDIKNIAMRYVECEYTIELMKSNGPEDHLAMKYFHDTRLERPKWYNEVRSKLDMEIPWQLEDEYVLIRQKNLSYLFQSFWECATICTWV